MHYAKRAAIRFANKIIDENSESRVGVIEFSGPSYIGDYGNPNNASLVEGLTNNKNNLAYEINDLSTGGGTNIQSGYGLANSLISQIPSSRDSVRAVVFLTDGVATASYSYPAGPNDPVNHNPHTEAAYNQGLNLYNNLNFLCM